MIIPRSRLQRETKEGGRRERRRVRGVRRCRCFGVKERKRHAFVGKFWSNGEIFIGIIKYISGH